MRKLPICLGHKTEQQGDSDVVPGCYIHYLAYNKFPGLHLDETRFWALHPDERVRNEQLAPRTIPIRMIYSS